MLTVNKLIIIIKKKHFIETTIGPHLNKQDFHDYLAKRTRAAKQRDSIRFLITYAKITETNIPKMSLELTNYDHEEAETLLILHALDVTKYNAFKECIVLSPDTDVFLLLIYSYKSLPNLIYFWYRRSSAQY